MFNAKTYLDLPTHRFTFMNAVMDGLSMRETMGIIEESILSRRRLQHVVVNVAKLVTMQTDAALRQDVCSSDLINIDGMGVVWGARLCGFHVPERVSGIDIMENVLRLCAEKGFRPYFLGARPEILEKAVSNIQARYPGLSIAGYHHGYFSREEEPAVMNKIAASKADCLFIAITSPTKERLLAEYKDVINVPFLMGVGGSIDVIAGYTKRAPLWMQKGGLEWFFRLIQEPKRMFRRYWDTNKSYAKLLWEEFKTKK